MKFKIMIDAETADHDADAMEFVPGVINDRFGGTAIKIGAIKITKESG